MYDSLFAARIAALVPPEPAPPPDYSKQKLRAITVACVGLVLLVVIGGLTAAAISLQQREELQSRTAPGVDQGESDLVARKALVESATMRKPVDPDLAARLRQELLKLDAAPGDDKQAAHRLQFLELLRKAEEGRKGPPAP